MRSPSVEGDFHSLWALKPTLFPILRNEVAARFLPWMKANHQAWHAGEKETVLEMCGSTFQQKTFKYQAITLDELRRKFSEVADTQELIDLLEETGCRPYFEGSF
jgi:hypothetical protein